ncbi:MAG: hypothetical protein ACC656_13900 [Candidatus Heimdallarchaeota archaeon]
MKGDRISSLSVNKINDKIELSILFNETIKSNILTLQINSSQGLQDLNDISIKGDSLIATLDGAVDGLYSIIIRYGSETTVFQKEIDSQGPSIEVNIKEGLADSNGKIWTTWDLILLDNEIIPRYNSLVTIDKNSDEIKLDQTETGYRITASNSYVEFTEVLVIIEVVDSLGQYNQFELNLTEFLLNNNDSKDQNKSIIENDTALIVGLLVLITLLILAYATLGKNKTKAN